MQSITQIAELNGVWRLRSSLKILIGWYCFLKRFCAALPFHLPTIHTVHFSIIVFRADWCCKDLAHLQILLIASRSIEHGLFESWSMCQVASFCDISSHFRWTTTRWIASNNWHPTNFCVHLRLLYLLFVIVSYAPKNNCHYQYQRTPIRSSYLSMHLFRAQAIQHQSRCHGDPWWKLAQDP